MDLRRFAPVHERFHDFHHDGGFKDDSAQRAGRCMFRIFQARQVAEYASVGEVHFWCLDQAFADVSKVGPQHDYLKCGLQN